MKQENGHSYKENSVHYNNHTSWTWDWDNALAVSCSAVLRSFLNTWIIYQVYQGTAQKQKEHHCLTTFPLTNKTNFTQRLKAEDKILVLPDGTSSKFQNCRGLQ